MDEALCPVDYASAGVIRDDDVFAILVSPMPKDVTLTCVMDCCHSGTMYVCYCMIVCIDLFHCVCITTLLNNDSLSHINYCYTIFYSLDLPYAFLADGTQEEMVMDPEFDFGPLMQMAQMGYEGLMKLHAQGKEHRRKRRNRWKKHFGF
jgi:hypothetical protein